MSGIKIVGNSSGTGTFTISSPNSNTSRTLTLPDEAGTIITTAGLPSGLVTTSDLPSGSVLQVFNVGGPASNISGTTQPVEVLSQAITPTSTSSKILLIGTAYVNTTSGSNSWNAVLLYKNGSILTNGNGPYSGFPHTNLGTVLVHQVIDSPATTSSTTYELYVGVGSGGTTAWTVGALRASLTVMEIAG